MGFVWAVFAFAWKTPQTLMMRWTRPLGKSRKAESANTGSAFASVFFLMQNDRWKSPVAEEEINNQRLIQKKSYVSIPSCREFSL
jgi:hypothetical protein